MLYFYIFVYMKRLLCLLAFCLILLNSFAYETPGQLLFSNFSHEDGLLDDSVRAVAQDSHGLIWVATREGVSRFNGREFLVPQELKDFEIFNSNINSVRIDKLNNLWVLTDDKLAVLNLDSGMYHDSDSGDQRYFRSVIPDDNGNVYCILNQSIVILDSEFASEKILNTDFNPQRISRGLDDNFWISSDDGFIYEYNAVRNSFKGFSVLDEKQLDANIRISGMRHIDSRSLLVYLSDGKLYHLNIERGVLTFLFKVSSVVEGALIQDVLALDSDEYWVATDKGLIVYNRKSDQKRLYTSDGSDPLSLCGTNLRCLFRDSADRVWVGSYFNGLSCMEKSPFAYLTESNNNTGMHLKGKTVRSFCEDSNGRIWMAAEDGYISELDTKSGRLFSYGQESGLPAEGNYQSIISSERLLYVGVYGDGVILFNPETHRRVRSYTVGNNNVVTLLRTFEGDILAGTTLGLYVLDRQNDEFALIEGTEGFVHALCQDGRGLVWIGYFRGALKTVDIKNNEVETVVVSGVPEGIGKMIATSLFEDKKGYMWVASQGKGLYRIDPLRNQDGTYNILNIRQKDGLPSDIVCSMVQSSGGKLWASTMKGIVSLDSDGSIDQVNSLSKIGNFFRYGSAMISDEGRVYMGTSEGVLSFNPEEIVPARYQLFLSGATLGRKNSSASTAEDGHTPVTSRRIAVRSKESSYIRLDVSFTGPVSSKEVRYRFNLSKGGVEHESITSEPSITYASLNPGLYSLNACVVGSEGKEDSLDIELNVIPPFYQSLFMRVVYILLAIALLIFCVIRISLRVKKKSSEQKEKFEAEMRKEVYESKMNFYTEVSHEIKTYLTMIKLPMDRVLNSVEAIKDNDDVVTVKTNLNKLMDFTNQILDTRKMDIGTLTLNYVRTDICKRTSEILKSFESVAEDNSVSLTYNIPDKPASTLCSAVSIEKIINNLLMNAVKYCDSRVHVEMELNDDGMTMTVLSDGKPIPAEERELIFKPFYQSKGRKSNISSIKGTGLGLPLSRSLAELQGGSLTLDEPSAEGNTFRLQIPMRLIEEDLGRNLDENKMSDAVYSTGTERRTILIVEDDRDLNNYVAKCLSEKYATLQARNGLQALEILSKNGVDMILSDIMMPELDGCQLCDKVKSEIEFSHIPVVLLTAVSGQEAQIRSMKSGADAYITKPFSMELLEAAMENIFRNREIAASRFMTSAAESIGTGGAGQGTIDDEFLKSLMRYIDENISNADMLSVESIAEHMCVSRSTLFRKVKAKANCNINELVMTCRLKKSADLLSTGKYRVNEVAFMLGFASPSYFTKLFSKQFGMSPSAMVDSRERRN